MRAPTVLPWSLGQAGNRSLAKAEKPRESAHRFGTIRIPQSPKVVDLQQAGFQLLGGRIDVAQRTGVPTLVYKIRQHVISLTAIPGNGGALRPPMRRSVQGYNVLGWITDGTAYWAVSDVNFGDLETFARLFRDAPS
jgi:anti-sigma factor RsiW